MIVRFSLLFVALMIITACTSGSSTGDAAQVVEDYLTAKVSSDEATIRGLICSDLEASIEREVASFASVEASIEDMSCTADGNTVSCDGQIIATYGTEDREFPLTSYQVVQEDGEWRWCGEGQ